VGADIDADDAAALRACGETFQHRLLAFAVEAEPVDDPLVGIEAKQARTRIAGLRLRRHGSNLDEAEAEAQQRIGYLAILVEAGGDADRVREIQPERAHLQPRVVHRRARQRRETQRLDRERMRILRVECAHQRPRQAVEQADHGAASARMGSGNTCRPSAPRGNGSTHLIVPASGSGPEGWGNRSPPPEGSHLRAAPRAPAATATRRRPSTLAKCRAAVSPTCAAVEKWMKPSLRSTAAPRNTPARSAARQSAASQIL